MQFNIRTFDVASGAVNESSAEGESADAVRLHLQQKGITVLSIAPVKRSAGARKGARFDAVLFSEELRTLLSSGMSLVEAIDTLASRDGGSRNGVLADIRQRLLDGKQFSSALELNAFPFSPLLIASVRASERSSRIETALEEYINYENLGRELTKKLVSAAIYPALVIGFGGAVSLFMIAYVVPRFARVYEDFAQSVSLPTMILMRTGQAMADHFGLFVAAVAAGLLALFLLYRNGILKQLVLRALRRSGTARHYMHIYQLARIFQTMSMLLRGGYTVSDAIPMAQSLAFEDQLRERVAQARIVITEGRRLSDAFSAYGLTDTVTERLLRVGERSGSLAKVMDVIAHTYRQEFTLFMERATRLAEPILLMAVALMIGAIIIMMYMPVFDLAGGL
jgi:general secretion pathway protein F